MAQLAAHYSPRRWHSQACHTFITRHYAGEFLPLTGVLCVVLLAILADQSTINSEALINSLTMGLVATFIALLLLLLWLEWGPQRRQLWLWLPILLPALPLVAGPVHAGAMAEPGWKLDGGGLGASAVGNAVDAVYPATRLAAH